MATFQGIHKDVTIRAQKINYFKNTASSPKGPCADQLGPPKTPKKKLIYSKVVTV
jgi:hypothetical protein